MKNNNSINVFDVANYIITNNPTENTPITHMKLHKLIYYAQVYHLIFKDSPLILNKLQAWMHGPVFSELFPLFKKYEYHPITKITRKGNHSKIQGIYKESLDIIIRNLGKYNGQQLSDKTHSEEP
ncbi:hypothetical protein LFWB_5350 [Candidatus Phytoplasma luffae]|uniref:Antitoxin SocA-like Panacea domain-containing protein n=1 Tax=Loofah witches'-broom phytoplasma TaxID=35773 RepID=A0A975FJS1_LOWBP|nr:type II toxin-antitoxin system antitoxin SocA domain-containing protein [Candidatus Phytoplasma luffae]QTX03101.1 hypothetical protein LFWB_5350 [Candidatus Phytoplasma luffae]